MGQFAEPEVIATFDRSWGDKKEELRLERGEYQGKATFALRLYWQTPDGAWRWAAQKPTQSGKCWERLNLKGKELRALGEALVAASQGASNDNAGSLHRSKGGFPLASIGNDDDIPF